MSDRMEILEPLEIEDTYNVISDFYNKYLKSYGVILPKLKNKNLEYTKDALVLVYLAYNYPNQKVVTKQELTEFIRRFYPDVNDVQQARHLARQKGWYIISSRRGNHVDVLERLKNKVESITFGDFYYLVSLEEPYPGFKKRIQPKSKDFEELKKKFDYRCATCGSREGEPNFKNPRRTTRLQKAHMDPLSKESGFIPQCEECNRAYRDWFVFDNEGRVRTIANPRVILRASIEVQKKVYSILKNKFGYDRNGKTNE
jgi:hypothetical protein